MLALLTAALGIVCVGLAVIIIKYRRPIAAYAELDRLYQETLKALHRTHRCYRHDIVYTTCSLCANEDHQVEISKYQTVSFKVSQELDLVKSQLTRKTTVSFKVSQELDLVKSQLTRKTVECNNLQKELDVLKKQFVSDAPVGKRLIEME